MQSILSQVLWFLRPFLLIYTEAILDWQFKKKVRFYAINLLCSSQKMRYGKPNQQTLSNLNLLLLSSTQHLLLKWAGRNTPWKFQGFSANSFWSILTVKTNKKRNEQKLSRTKMSRTRTINRWISLTLNIRELSLTIERINRKSLACSGVLSPMVEHQQQGGLKWNYLLTTRKYYWYNTQESLGGSVSTAFNIEEGISFNIYFRKSFGGLLCRCAIDVKI